MKKYQVKFCDGCVTEVWASNAHNAKQIAIGVCCRSSGKLQTEIAEQIISVKLEELTQ